MSVQLKASTLCGKQNNRIFLKKLTMHFIHLKKKKIDNCTVQFDNEAFAALEVSDEQRNVCVFLLLELYGGRGPCRGRREHNLLFQETSNVLLTANVTT